MGRLVLITPRYCIPIASRDHDENLLEEGIDGRQQPQPTPAAWRFFNIIARCLTITLSIGEVIFAFVGRHFNWYPELQDPSTVAMVMFIALLQVGLIFMITQGDVKINDIIAQEEQEL